MFDVFTEQIEVLIKEGIANLYWYKGDLRKACLRSGITEDLCSEIGHLHDSEGRPLTKRQQMDALYERLRKLEFNRRLEISRNFVRILIEHKNFVPQDAKHRIQVAERAALKLRELQQQEDDRDDRDYKERIRQKTEKAPLENYQTQLCRLRDVFVGANALPAQQRGYALERLFMDLMRISGIPVEEPFRISGEQL